MSLNLPSHYDPKKVDQVWRVDYAELAETAPVYAKKNGIKPAKTDGVKVGLMVIDEQNTFCIPGYELYVGGRSGTGAVDDTRRLCEFIYRNLNKITKIHATMDSHTAQQIFHPVFFIGQKGEHPAPYTDICSKDIRTGKWRVNPAIVGRVPGPDYNWLQSYVLEYCTQLENAGKFGLTIWPYHAMLGGVGHALVSSFHEAAFFHSMARDTDVDPHTKGGNPLDESYSALRPEILFAMGQPIAQKSTEFIKAISSVDKLYVAGQAKSHCVAWTVADLLEEIQTADPAMAKKVYLLEDCMSPVVVPGVVDHTDATNETFARFAKAGMNIVRSTDSI